MIFHASIPAADPQRVAAVVAELWRGESVSFPPFPGSFVAFAHDARGTELEVVPRAMEQVPGEAEVGTRMSETPQRFGPVHLAIGTPLEADEVMAIGRREGWTVRPCRRGGPDPMGFDLIELWVEDSLLLEILTPAMQRQYLAFMTGRPAQEMFGLSRRAA